MLTKLSFALLGFIVMMLALAGCSSNVNNTTDIITGTVVTPTGTLIPSSTSTFFLNGAQAGAPMSNTNGMFSYGISPGTYTIEVTGTLAGETTFLGSLAVNNSSQALTIIAPTALSQLPGNVTPPADPTATLVVQAVNSIGIQQPQASYTVTVGSQTPVSSTTNGTSAYAVLTEIPTTTTSVIITPTNGQPITVNNLSCTAGSVVLLDAVVPAS